jgi:hypothetical protein
MRGMETTQATRTHIQIAGAPRSERPRRHARYDLPILRPSMARSKLVRLLGLSGS